MSQNKKNNRRKALAVGLAVLGVAGLTLASAAQLNLTGPTSIQAGTATVASDCQTSTIPVTFAEPTYAAGSYTTTSLTLGSIDAACATALKSYKVTLVGTSVEVTGTLTAAQNSITVNFPAGQLNNITGVAAVIY